MLNEILFVAGMFVTRIALPVLLTFWVGHLLARKLQDESAPAKPH